MSVIFFQLTNTKSMDIIPGGGKRLETFFSKIKGFILKNIENDLQSAACMGIQSHRTLHHSLNCKEESPLKFRKQTNKNIF